jgi:aryl-alcohol dehydrogenase-like predicted oxidoreductase
MRRRLTGATPKGTEAFRSEALKRGVASEHFREIEGLHVSSIGIGTYLGECDQSTDDLYRLALVEAVVSGANVIDTSVNYRCQRSERTIGRALSDLAERGIARDQIVVCTKGGYLPFDGTPPSSPRDYFQKRFVSTGILSAADLVGGIHALTPSFLKDQVSTSLENLGCETLDVYYLHNPETQLQALGRKAFLGRLRGAFECLEDLAGSGKLRFYGTATWSGYRSRPQARDWLCLQEVLAVAREAGGEGHRFRFVQAPYNLAMTEIFSEPNQPLRDKMVSLCVAADALGVQVVSSASIAQGRLKSGLPDWLGTLFRGSSSDVQRALQFVRSTPGVAVALVGMKTEAHVLENLGTARIPPASVEDFLKLFEVQQPPQGEIL